MEPPQETEAIATEEQPVGEAPPAHEVTATKQVDETPQPEDSLAEATRAEEPVVETFLKRIKNYCLALLPSCIRQQ